MSTDPDDTKKSKENCEPSTKPKYVIRDTQLGIWKVITATQEHAKGVFPEILETYPLVIRLFADIYHISPRSLYLLLLSRVWDGIKIALMMQLENMLLGQVELTVSTGVANIHTTAFAIVGKILYPIVDSYVQWTDDNVMPILRSHVERHFQLEIMKTTLMRDLPISIETSERAITPDTAWDSFRKLFDLFQSFFEISSQLLLLIEISRVKGGSLLFMVLLMQALMTKFTHTALWKLSFLAYISNDGYKRVKSLEKFAGGDFRQDIISNNLGNWITSEYKKAFAAIGNASTDDVCYQFGRSSPLLEISRDFLSDIPSFYFTVMMINHPQYLSIASLATLQSSRRYLFRYMRGFLSQIEDIREGLNSVKKIYGPQRSSVIRDGTLSYPCPTEKEDGSEGMSFTLKNISFAYPSGGKKTNALKGVNLNIKPGQLVVIVGANGSGKSTLTRILARLYDPSSGELLIDGRPSSEYRVGDLHVATAHLSQDSKIYPLTMAENIGLGYPEHSSDLEMIKEAAREGGAAEFIGELANEYQTMLEIFENPFHMNLHGDKTHPLWVISDKMAKQSDISGGQRQRLIAARTFMRFKSGKVKFVIVDEPSSALDADGELELFQRLISARQGKTMVFVTHRFGHLTKFADQLICMKDGMLVESGSHAELMSADGEYAKLYKIQAQAFSEGAAESIKQI